MQIKHCKRKTVINNVFVLEDVDTEKETRRTSRCGIVLAIIAFIAGVLTIMYNIIKKFSQILILENEICITYCYIFMYILLCLIILVIFDGLLYAFIDIGRYNVKNVKYKEYDKISDYYYNCLVLDVRCEVIFVFAALYLFFWLYTIYLPDSLQKLVSIIFCGITALIILIYMINRISTLLSQLEFIGKFVLKLIIIFCLGSFFTVSSIQSQIKINFDKNIVFIENKSNQKYDCMEISIYNDNGKKIVNYLVDEGEILLAEELNRQVLGETEGEISYLPRNSLYWTYEYDIGKLNLKPDKYNIIIDVRQGNTKLHFENEFIYNAKQIKYAKKEFIKIYK